MQSYGSVYSCTDKVARANIILSAYIKFTEKIIKLWHLISLVFPDQDKWMA